jgi:putative ABC transport system ATP-binding protein
MMKALIEVEDLSKIYGMGNTQVIALDCVDLHIDQGEFIAIMGPSGSGKSTLMNILGCLDRPSSGRYVLDGKDVSDLDKDELAAIRSQYLGFIFQSYNLLPRMSTLENVMMPLIYNRKGLIPSEEQEAKAHEVLVNVGLADREHHYPRELSGGQQQRAAIGRALINDPLLILADEPTGNLDTQSGEEIMQLLHQLHERGRTIVMVTHDPEIAAHTQRIIRIRDGRIESDRNNGHKEKKKK